MIDCIEKQNCCGCGACVQVCPQKCIELKSDDEGFWYPKVIPDACVNCGLCRDVCPVKDSLATNEPRAVYAAKAACEEIRHKSSSGGIFTLLAQHILNQDGVVFGAAFDRDLSVHHVQIETIEELQMLRGSKYLQSRIEDTYIQARNALEQGRIVLFSGVGCQIAGLKAFLRKDYQNLYTVDVLCHGVPSPTVWSAYLDEMSKNYKSDPENALFRSKRNGWHDFASEFIFFDGGHYCKSHRMDWYMQCFLSNICLRPSCHNCHFREGKSGADITLGDAWGIEKWMPELDDDKGTSLVLINSEKGCLLWEEIHTETEFKAVSAETALTHNMVYKQSVKPHPNRARFFEAFKNGANMEALVRLTRKPLHRRCISFAKRAIKKLLSMCCT